MSLSDFEGQVPLTVFCSQVFLGRIEKIFLVPCGNAMTGLQENQRGWS